MIDVLTPVPVAVFRNKHDTDPTPAAWPWEQMTQRLTRHACRPAKDGPLFSPVRYREGATRGNEGVESLSCYVADIDDGTTVDDLRGRWRNAAGEPLRFIVYSTFQSTADAPRWRVVFPLARPVPAREWPPAWRKLTAALTDGRCDPSTKDPARMSYLPACPPDLREQAFAESGDGALLDPDDYPDPPQEDLADRMAATIRRRDARNGASPVGQGQGRPGEDYSARATVEDVVALLEKAGWRVFRRRGHAVYLTRPGKDGDVSGVVGFPDDPAPVFYCFTSSAASFEAGRAYSAFSILGLVEHRGDFTEAARALGKQGYGDQTPPAARREMASAGKNGTAGKNGAPPPDDRMAPPNTTADEPPLPLTEIGYGQRLVRRHGRDIRYSYEWDKWLIWDLVRWAKDKTGEIERRAKDTARSIFEEAAGCPDPTQQSEIAKYALQAQKLARRQGMVTDARSEPGVAVCTEDLDRHPWLLTCGNGTVDLRTGCLRPSDRADLITKRAGTDYNPDTPCPLWEAFLARILPDAEVRAYVQRAAGYALTGSVAEQCLFFLHGGGQNGKSTLLGTILAMLGDYGIQAAPDLLIAKENNGGPNNEVAELQGARFIATIEVEDGKRMAEGLVKQITGGDRIKARFMRQDYFEFDPSHKIFLAANHKPTVRGNDFAIWRRIKMIPFGVQIPDGEKDPTLGDKLRETELPGILAWAVRGCLEWQKTGLAEPDAVKAATDNYRQEMDVLGDFLADCCEIRPALRVSSSAIYTAYTKWCEENSERALGKKSFSQRLREQPGVFPAVGVGTKASRGWQGVGLKDKGGYEIFDTSDTSDKLSPISTKKNDSRSVIGESLSEVSEVSEGHSDADWEEIR